MVSDHREPPSLFTISHSPLTGRSFRATQDLAVGTCVLDITTPYSCTIYKQFRNEVCAECWRYECGRRDFLTYRDLGKGAGLLFCDHKCRDAWVQREGPAAIKFLEALESARKRNEKATATTDELAAQDITAEFISQAWEEVRAQPRPKTLKKWRQIQLDDFEADLARYVLFALAHLHRETNPSGGILPKCSDPAALFGATWSDLTTLQSGELQQIKRFPELLQNYTRIYQVLKSRLTVDEIRNDQATSREASTSALHLTDVITVENVRAILSVDPGNSFGIWQMPMSLESEGLGFGVYPVPSFFNHNCWPNVRKDREGRRLRFVTTKEVRAGEELCISYGHVEDMPLEDRRNHLREGWFFVCLCSRCIQEGGRSQD